MTDCPVSIDELNHDHNSEEVITAPLSVADFLHDKEWEELAIQSLISHPDFEKVLIKFARKRNGVDACCEFGEWIFDVAMRAADDIEVEV